MAVAERTVITSEEAERLGKEMAAQVGLLLSEGQGEGVVEQLERALVATMVLHAYEAGEEIPEEVALVASRSMALD